MLTMEEMNRDASTILAMNNEGIIPENSRTPEQKQMFNPLHDLTSWVEEWKDDLVQRGQDISNKAAAAYEAGVLPDSIDDMVLPQQDVSPLQENVAMALQDAVDDARFAATKQPLSFTGDVAGAFISPWIPLAVQGAIMAKELQMAQRSQNAPAMSDQAKEALAPMLLGSMAAALTHGGGSLLKNVAPRASKVLTTPFVGSGVAVGATMAYDDNIANYAKEHPQRFAVQSFTMDAALGAKKLAKMDWSSKTNPVTDTEAIARTVNPETGEATDVRSAILANQAVGSPTKPIRAAEVQPVKTKESVPVTPKEEAFPERRPDIQKSQDIFANATAEEVLASRRIEETMQGAYGEKLVASTDNLYPTNVSINQIWAMFKKLVPARPNNMSNMDDSTLGFFNIKGRGIRVRGFRPWSVLCHELGHAISKEFEFARGAEVEAELAKGAQSIWSHGEYGDFHSPEGFATYVEEGRAAFMNEYLINPEMAKKHFPLTYEAFETAIASDVRWSGHMNTIGQMVRRWCNMNTMQKASGSKHWGDTTDRSIGEKIADMKNKVEEGYSDEFAPLRNTVEGFTETYGEKPTVENDPAVLAQRAKESINASEAVMIDGNGFDTATVIPHLANKFGTALYNVVLSDVFLPFSVGGERGKILKGLLQKLGIKDFYEAFSNYQSAKHELELIKVKNAERIKKAENAIKTLEKNIQLLMPHMDKVNNLVDELTMTYAPLKEKLDSLNISKRETLHSLSDLQSKIAKDTNLIKRLGHRLETITGKVGKTMDKGRNTAQRLHREEQLFPKDVAGEGNKAKSNSVVLDENGNVLRPNKMMMGRYKQLLKIYYRDVTDFRGMADTITKELQEAKARLAKNSSEIEGHKAKLAEVTTQLKDLEPVIQPLGKQLSKAKKELARLEEQVQGLKEQQKTHTKKILDINAGRDDYATSMSRQENAEILEMCKDVPEFEQASILWKQWHENVLRIAVAGGILPKKTMDYFLKTYPEYIPLKRDFTIEGYDKVYGSITHALSEEGSSRVVQDTFTQAVLDMKTIVSKVERNRVGQALAKMSKGEYGHYLMMKVPDGKEAAAHQIITVWEDGKPTYYQCMADGLYDAYTSTNKAFVEMNLDIISKWQEHTATILRIGATSTPAFALWNLGRDILDATILNKDGRRNPAFALREPFLLLYDGLSMMFSKKDSQLKAEYKTYGVQYTTRLSTTRDITGTFRKIVNPTKSDKVKKYAFKPIQILTDFNDACEQLARMALYKRVRKRGGSAIEAATVASDSTVNFMRSGSKVRSINKMIPFFNATLQGDFKVWKELKKDPLGVGLAAFECLTLPTLVCYWLNKDEDWYRDMPLDQKNKAWYLKIDGVIRTFPKPPLLGQLFGSLIERVLDAAYESDDNEAINDCLLTAVQGLFPTYTTPMIEKVLEWKSNYNYYKGRPIVDQRLGKVSDKYQYNIYTSEMAKGVGNLLNVSPMKVDNTFYGLTGSLGYAFNSVADWALKNNETPDRKWTEYTRFTYTEGGRQTRSQDIFYKGLDSLEKEANDAKRLGKPLKDTKALEGMKQSREMVELITNGVPAKNIKAARKKLGKWANDPDVRKGLRAIENDPNLTGAEKRAKIDKLVKLRNNIYRTANKKYLNQKYIQSPE